MKRKILSLILAVCMLLSSLPVLAAAEEESALLNEDPVFAASEEEAAASEPEEVRETPEAAAPEETDAPAEQGEPVPVAPEPEETPAEEATEEEGTEEPETPPEPEEPTEAPEEPTEASEEPAEGPQEQPEGPAAEDMIPEEDALPQEDISGKIAPLPEEELPAEEQAPSAPEETEEEGEKTLLDTSILTPENFPDIKFRQSLYTQYGALKAADAAAITTLDVSNEGIEDLTGIAFFSKLTKFDCSGNKITALSLSTLTNLEILDCSYNDLEHLLVRGCSKLTSLTATGNALETLDVSGLTLLNTLSLLSNPLVTLKISGCEALVSFSADKGKLATLNAKGCTLLSSLDLSTATEIAELDIRDCTSLLSLTVNAGKLKTLRLSGCSALLSLDCHNTSVDSLDLSGCSELVSVNCSFCELTSLTVRSCPKLAALDCSGNYLSSLELPYVTTLKTLKCDANELTKLDVTGCMALETLSCGDNRLASFSITDCFSLKVLTCQDNRLSALDLSTLSKLQELDCSGNEITELDLKACPSLTSLTCGNNRLMHLDKTVVTALTKADLGSQHPAAKLTAYLPAEEDPAYGFADLREIITDDEKSTVSTSLPVLDAKQYLPVIATNAETIDYAIDYGAAQMKVTVPVEYRTESPFSIMQSYLLLDNGESIPDMNDLIGLKAFAGTSACSILWEAKNPQETAASAVISVSGDTITAVQEGSAVLYAKPFIAYNAYDFFFAPLRLRVDAGESAGAADEVTRVSVPATAKTVELFSTDYTRIELLLERPALKDLSASGRLVEEKELEPVGGFIHNIASAKFVDADTASNFDLSVLDDRTLAIVPKYLVMQAAWYSSSSVKSSYRSSVQVTLDNGKSFVTNRVTLTVKQTQPSVTASAITIDTLDIFSAGAKNSFPICFNSGARVVSAEPDPDRKQPLPSWLCLDKNGLELIYAGDEEARMTGYVYLLARLEGWAIKVPVTVKVQAACSLEIRFAKKNLALRADAADSDLVSFTTKPLSPRGINFFQDNAALTEARENGKTYQAADLFTMKEYYDGKTGYYGWYLQVKPGCPADDGKTHSYTVSLCVADRTVYFYVKVIPYTARPVLTVKNGGTVDMAIYGSNTSLSLSLSNMNINAEDGAGNYLVNPVFHITLGSPYGTDVTSLFKIDYDRKTGKVHVYVDGYQSFGKQYYAFLWAGVSNGGYANAEGYGRFTVKESSPKRAKPSFSLKKSGYIDTARELSSIKLQPSVKNYPLYDLNNCTFTFYKKSGRKWVTMTDWYQYFDVDIVDGCFYISAADPAGHPLKTGTKYAFSAKWLFGTIECSYGTAKKPIKLTVKQGKASFTTSLSSSVISRLDAYDETLVTFLPKDASLNNIRRVTIDKKSAKYFTFTETEQNGVYRLGWTASTGRLKLKAGAKRTVTVKIFLEGNNTTKPNATIKLKIKLA